MRSDRTWQRALDEHREVVRGFHTVLAQLPLESWQRAPVEGKWSPAAVTLHLIRAYELGRDGAQGRTSMQMRVSPAVAWASRTFLLPLILASRKFPRGVKAPREVRPDPLEVSALEPEATVARFAQVADEAARSLHERSGATPPVSVRHAYFGSIDLYQALRLLSAHTRHHTRELNR